MNMTVYGQVRGKDYGMHWSYTNRMTTRNDYRGS